MIFQRPAPRLRAAGILALLTVILAYVYAPLLWEYGRTDDYVALEVTALEQRSDFANNQPLRAGRPLTGWATVAALRAADTVADFGWIRLGGLSGVIFTVLGFSWICRRAVACPELRWLAALLLGLSPPMLVYAGWMVCFTYGYAAALALGAGHLWTRPAQSPSRALAGAGLLLAALATYQPAAGLALVPAGLRLLRPNDASWRRTVGQTLALYGLTVGVYLGGYRLLGRWVELGQMGGRARLTSDPLDRLTAFITGPVADAAGIGMLAGPLWLRGGLLLLTIGLFGVCFRAAPRRQRWQRAASFLALLPLSALTVLAIDGQAFYYRTVPAVFGLALIVWLVALDRWAGWRRPLAAGLLAILALLATWNARILLDEGIASPNTREWAAVKASVAEVGAIPANLVVDLPAERPNPFGRFTERQLEFGHISVQTSWGPAAMWRQALRERLSPGEAAAVRTNVLVVEAGDWRPRDGLPVIDGVKAIYGRPAPPPAAEAFADPAPLDFTHGLRALPLAGDGWQLSPWLGYVNTYLYRPPASPQLYHYALGYLYVGEVEAGGRWLHHPELGWLWTSPEGFPYIRLKTDGRWLYVQPSADGATRLWDGQALWRELPVPPIE